MKLYLTFLLPLFFFLFLTETPSAAPNIIFSEEVIAFDPNGNPYPAVDIVPSQFEGMAEYLFKLNEKNFLVIKTNISDPESRGLEDVANTIKRGYQFIEQQSSQSLDENILIYLIEMNCVPNYYRFRAEYSGDEEQWGEVRLALIEKGQPLVGPDAPDRLNELLLDTLPHELGHDLLAKIPALRHDIDGRPSYHTRWFIEGVCELFAKHFARQESLHQWRELLIKRNVGSVMTDPQIRSHVFNWSQENNNPRRLESNLYGASMLLLMQWTEAVPLNLLLEDIAKKQSPLDGSELVAMMESSTGFTRDEILDHALILGTRLVKIAGKPLKRV